MSIELIQQYYTKVAKLIQYGGSKNESSVRKAFQELLDDYARSKDPTIREKFNTYCFAEHKEQVIELLQRVCTVSVQTM